MSALQDSRRVDAKTGTMRTPAADSRCQANWKEYNFGMPLLRGRWLVETTVLEEMSCLDGTDF
jgi:hypothetical protein